MKIRFILLGIGAALLIGWLGWRLASGVSLPHGQERDTIAEAEYCASLKAADAGKRMQAYRELGKLWERQYWRSPLYGTATEPDESIRAAMEALKTETDDRVSIVGSGTLSLAPPVRVQASWIEELLKEVAEKAPSEWGKWYCVMSVRNLYWRQGLAPSDAVMAMIDERLTNCRDPRDLYYFLYSITNMHSDLRPLEKTIRLLLQYPSDDVQKMAKQVLDNLKLPVTPEHRRDSLQTVVN